MNIPNKNLFHFYKFIDLVIYFKHDIFIWHWLKSYVGLLISFIFPKFHVIKIEKDFCQKVKYDYVSLNKPNA